MQKIRWKFVCTQTSLSLHQVFFPPPQNTIIYMKKTRALPQPPNQTKINYKSWMNPKRIYIIYESKKQTYAYHQVFLRRNVDKHFPFICVSE